MKNKVSLIGIAAILLSLTAVTVPVAAQEIPGWHVMRWAPEETFRHTWEGKLLLTTESGIQYWELESGGMMPSMGGAWVKMTIMWDPVAQKGRIIKFDHYGMYLHFTGWRGTIAIERGTFATEYDGDNTATHEVYNFQVSGRGVGSYGPDSSCGNLIIFGSFKGVLHSDGDANPGPFSHMTSEATERALLIYHVR